METELSNPRPKLVLNDEQFGKLKQMSEAGELASLGVQLQLPNSEGLFPTDASPEVAASRLATARPRSRSMVASTTIALIPKIEPADGIGLEQFEPAIVGRGFTAVNPGGNAAVFEKHLECDSGDFYLIRVMATKLNEYGRFPGCGVFIQRAWRAQVYNPESRSTREGDRENHMQMLSDELGELFDFSPPYYGETFRPRVNA